jgi:hypothetical protein
MIGNIQFKGWYFDVNKSYPLGVKSDTIGKVRFMVDAEFYLRILVYGYTIKKPQLFMILLKAQLKLIWLQEPITAVLN